MHLSFVTSNILHQVLSDEVNIVYNPSHTLFDKILYCLDYNFFVFSDYVSKAENCLSYSNAYIDLRNYDLYIHSGIASSNGSTLPLTLHANMLVFEHQPKQKNLKKEDLAILNQRLATTKKIFFDDLYSKTWGLQNSLAIPYGIPSLFKPELDYNDRKDVLIATKMNATAAHQIKAHLESKGLICSIYDDKELDIKQINKKINNYKILINLDDEYLLNLVGAACGSFVLKISGHPVEIPNNYKYTEINDLIGGISNIITQQPDLQSIQDYISTNHDFDYFKIKLCDIIQTSAKREAFIL